MANYAHLTGTTVDNVVVANTEPTGYVGPVPANVYPGYTTPDGGTTWVAPAPVAPTQEHLNFTQIQANILAHRTTLQTWIAANPSGAVLTGPQTLVLANMLVGLCNLLLADYSSITGT